MLKNGNNKNNKNPVNQKVTIEPELYTSEVDYILGRFDTSANGLTDSEAKKRLMEHGHNELAKRKKRGLLYYLLTKFYNPLVVVLLLIAGVSFYLGYTGDDTQAMISGGFVLMMAFISVGLSFFQEYNAGKEAERLREMIRTTTTILRDGQRKEAKIRELVPGDVVDLYAGDVIPADLRIISCKDLFINQASLTGESFPVEKISGPVKLKETSVTALSNIAFMGSSVISGTAYGIVIKTGMNTQFGEISRKLAARKIENNFDRGVKSFTWLMIKVMLILVIAIFAINALIKHDFLQAFLFSLAVAVGLTPEMLPMIVAINLSKGAISMSKKQVIVKRLNAIQNLGAMDVLCTDKTGTLTQNTIVLEKHLDVKGNENEDVLRFGYINSFYQTGLKNLLDNAILAHEKLVVKEYRKVDEIPFDYGRKIMSVVVEAGGKRTLISKGAPEEIFSRCTRYELHGAHHDVREKMLSDLKIEYDKLSGEGFRVLAIAYKDVADKQTYTAKDEEDLVLKGYLAFLDPPKPTAKKAISMLKKHGIDMKIITGDNLLVTRKICDSVGIEVKGVVSGELLDEMKDESLKELAEIANVFVRMSPIQKERIIRILHDNGHVVGYLGDGINDAPALKASDVGISVNNAVEIARESADIILMRKSLRVLEDGVVEGRKTFGNIIKYIKMGSSSNFGNMISMSGASIFLPFLPMAPIQILLNNFLYDVSQIAIPTDEVDEEYVARPRSWDVKSIQKFMLYIGPISSLFDFITFFVLLFFFHASIETQAMFHTGWFLESLCTQTLVIYIIRTNRKPFIESMPSKFLVAVSLGVLLAGFAIALSPLGLFFQFAPLPPMYFLALALIIASYLVMVLVLKRYLIKKGRVS